MRVLALIFLSFFITSCDSNYTPPSRMTLEKAGLGDLKGWEEANHEKSLEAFRITCNRFDELKDIYKNKWPAGKAKDWRNVCQRARDIRDSKAKFFFESNFTPYAVGNNHKRDGIFTGYYVPELNGSRKKHDKYKYAIYKYPKNIKKPYYTRKQIENGALNGKKLELLYVDDNVDLFFLQIQGSGRIKLDDGSTIKVGYNGNNGYDYTSIGKIMVKRGIFELKEVTAQKIKKWLREHPKEGEDLMNMNESYVFFRELKTKGVIGAHGVEVTSGYSLAVDDDYIAYGLPIWLETTMPDGSAFNRLMIAQDTGGAIKGPVRGDVFVGYGQEAGEISGKMRQTGRYYLLIPNNLARWIED